VIDWLKGISKSVWIALLAFIAALAVVKAQQKGKSARKWQDRSVKEAQSDVADSTKRAEDALLKAKIANVDAKMAKENARKKLDAIARTEPDMGNIVSGWRNARLRDN
jgi:biopolymer transport protein ExbB/TolQ